MFGGAGFGFSVGEGVVEVADLGGVVVGDFDEGEDVAVGFVESADDLRAGDGEVAGSGDSALDFDGEDVAVLVAGLDVEALVVVGHLKWVSAQSSLGG